MTEKKCARCGEIKPVSEFHKDNNMKSGLKSWCKKCVKEEYLLHKNQRDKTTKQWKIDNRDKCDLYDRKTKERKYEFIDSMKTPCVKCGEERLYVIDFHHIDPSEKLFNIARSTRTNESLLQERKKCVCLCANCHAEFHHLYGMNPKNPVESLQKYLKEK